MPDAKTYVRCRPCNCSEDRQILPWDGWHAINQRAWARLRKARAVYPIAIVPGFHDTDGPIVEYRLRAALTLMKNDWVAAIMVSGGHRKGGYNEALKMLAKAKTLGYDVAVETQDRIFVEPCANTTLTNMRNGLRMLAALGLPSGLLVTDSKMSGQAIYFHQNLETEGSERLGCVVGRVSHLVGDGPFTRTEDSGTGCQPSWSARNNPIGFILPHRKPSIFWVSPVGENARGERTTALDCVGGADVITSKEPDNQDPFESECLPAFSPRALCGEGT